jgi:membrane-associated protein
MDFLFQIDQLIRAFGYAGIAFIIFAESGLFFGFFFPGDSLLLTAGLFAFKGEAGMSIAVLIPLVFVAAVLGDNVGYWFGNKTGPRIFVREESRFFKPRNLRKAKEFYDRYGGITLVLARFMPFIRTFVPIVAGAVDMEYRRFFFFNLIGGLLWGIGVTMAGYTLGALIPKETLDKYFLLIVVVVIFVSALPTLIHLWQENRASIMMRVRALLAAGREPGA